MKRKTPRLDAYLERLLRDLEPRGARADLARFLADGDEKLAPITQTQIARWYSGRALPSAESLLGIEEWRKKRKNG